MYGPQDGFKHSLSSIFSSGVFSRGDCSALVFSSVSFKGGAKSKESVVRGDAKGNRDLSRVQEIEPKG